MQNENTNNTEIPATFEAVKMIAFRDKDIEGDTWCEQAFLFKDEEDVELFFTADNSVLLDVYTEIGKRVLKSFKVHKTLFDYISAVSFETEYAGEVTLYRMNDGYVCSRIITT